MCRSWYLVYSVKGSLHSKVHGILIGPGALLEGMLPSGTLAISIRLPKCPPNSLNCFTRAMFCQFCRCVCSANVSLHSKVRGILSGPGVLLQGTLPVGTLAISIRLPKCLGNSPTHRSNQRQHKPANSREGVKPSSSVPTSTQPTPQDILQLVGRVPRNFSVSHRVTGAAHDKHGDGVSGRLSAGSTPAHTIMPMS